MKSSVKMQQIESTIAVLERTRKNLLEQRNQEIAQLISRIDLASIDNKTLMGGFLHLSHTLNTDPSKKEEWRIAGEKFLRKSRNIKNSKAPG